MQLLFIFMEEMDLASGLLEVSHAQIVEFERNTIPEFKKVFWVRLLLGGTAWRSQQNMLWITLEFVLTKQGQWSLSLSLSLLNPE